MPPKPGPTSNMRLPAGSSCGADKWRTSNPRSCYGGEPRAPDATDRLRPSLWSGYAVTRVGRVRFLLVADAVGEVVGMALVTPASSRPSEVAVVQMVFVAPECWGGGIGGKLLAAALAEARTRGFERVRLWTHADDERVRRLYEGHGFGRTGVRLVGESGEPIVLYERPL